MWARSRPFSRSRESLAELEGAPIPLDPTSENDAATRCRLDDVADDAFDPSGPGTDATR
jgi:hypothetical protein